ncbi:reverse transcriptase domain-containing protein [Photobacterium kagoshimensis]|uniref:reverse transcriptase domain-containing protein n=1 Tax=Photobacterium kagoshimensis TaxID=2910242 RepID=UPI003D14AE8B
MRELKIDKGNGKHRTVVAINKDERYEYRDILENKIEEMLTKALVQHNLFHVVHGRKHSNIVANAVPHQQFQFTLSIDLKSCFDSITRSLVEQAGLVGIPEACFVNVSTANEPIAAQGLPTSSAICNLVLLKADLELIELLNAQFNDKYAYTRYIDDLTISFNGCPPHKLPSLISHIGLIIHKHGFTVNPDKIELQDAGHGRRKVCGLHVDHEGVYIPRKLKRTLRALAHQQNYDGLTGKQSRRFNGLTSHGNLSLASKAMSSTKDADFLLYSVLTSGDWGWQKAVKASSAFGRIHYLSMGEYATNIQHPHKMYNPIDDEILGCIKRLYMTFGTKVFCAKPTSYIKGRYTVANVIATGLYSSPLALHETELVLEAFLKLGLLATPEDFELLGAIEQASVIQLPRSSRERATFNSKAYYQAVISSVKNLFPKKFRLKIAHAHNWLLPAVIDELGPYELNNFLYENSYALRYLDEEKLSCHFDSVVTTQLFALSVLLPVSPHLKSFNHNCKHLPFNTKLNDFRELCKAIVHTNATAALYLIPCGWFIEPHFKKFCMGYFDIDEASYATLHAQSIVYRQAIADLHPFVKSQLTGREQEDSGLRQAHIEEQKQHRNAYLSTLYPDLNDNQWRLLDDKSQEMYKKTTQKNRHQTIYLYNQR